MSKGSPISPSLMATKSAGATKAPERADRTAEQAVVAADLEPDHEAEGIAQPIDGRLGIVVIERGGDARPAGGRRFHRAFHSILLIGTQ